ncbi:transcriptional regulator, partial [Cronobacter dublinensis]
RAGWQQFDDDKAAQIYRVVSLHIDWILAGLSGSFRDE